MRKNYYRLSFLVCRTFLLEVPPKKWFYHLFTPISLSVYWGHDNFGSLIRCAEVICRKCLVHLFVPFGPNIPLFSYPLVSCCLAWSCILWMHYWFWAICLFSFAKRWCNRERRGRGRPTQRKKRIFKIPLTNTAGYPIRGWIFPLLGWRSKIESRKKICI